MVTESQSSALQAFFNLGGIAGALSLIWQIATYIKEYSHRARLRCEPFEPLGGVMDVPFPESGRSERYVTLKVKNIGRRYARGSVAHATASPVHGGTPTKTVQLHWAEDSPPMNPATGTTLAKVTAVDIEPNGTKRLDVAFSSSRRQGCCLASIPALNGNYLGDSHLAQGAYRVEVRVTSDNGQVSTSVLQLNSPRVWHDLNAWTK
jgi:hypothetical protein